jgi:hypothetical protein
MKCSVRLRPRSEWLPLELPKSLQLVPRERWERVQQQLARNLTFSPRNEKHAYLLKRLVQCGGCGSRYIGDPCHGKYYYRCIARCKKMPSVPERILNEAVKQAVESVILNPSLMLDPIRQLDEMERQEENHQQGSAEDLEHEAKRLDAEEQRVLDAYRAGIISPEQLAQQLEKLNTGRATLQLQQAELSQTEQIPVEQVERAVTDYCAEAASNLANFSEEQWREFLQTIIQTVTFHGDHIKIRGRIPIGDARGSELLLDAPVTALNSMTSPMAERT